MSVLTHDSKIVTSGGKALGFAAVLAAANAVSGVVDKTLGDAVATISDELAASQAAVTAKGGTVSPGGTLAQLAADIATIPSGGGAPVCALDSRNAVEIPDAYVSISGSTATLESATDGVSAFYFDLSDIDVQSFSTLALVSCIPTAESYKYLRVGWLDSIEIGSTGFGLNIAYNMVSTGGNSWGLSRGAVPAGSAVDTKYLAIYVTSDKLRAADYFAVLLY